MDLSSWNWEENGIVDLNGEWEFYWGQLLEPDDFKTNNTIKPEYMNVPGEWAQNGYATYRLQVRVPDINTDYNFIFSSMSSSAKLWINGTLCMQRGRVGSYKDQSKPQWIHKYYTPIQY